MILGYYFTDAVVLYNNFITPLGTIPLNILQFVVGLIISSFVSEKLKNLIGKI